MKEVLGRFLKRGDLVYYGSDNISTFGIVLDKSTLFAGQKINCNGTVVLLNTLDKDLENVKSDLFYKYTLREKDTLYGEQKPGDVFLVHKTSQGVLYDYYWVYIGKTKIEAENGTGFIERHLYYKLNFLSSYRELFVNTVEKTVKIDLKNGSIVYKPDIVEDFKNYLGNYELLDFDKFKENLYESSGEVFI